MSPQKTDYAKINRDFYKPDYKYLKSSDVKSYKAYLKEYYSKEKSIIDHDFSIEDIALCAKGKTGYSVKLILKKNDICYIADKDCNVISDGYDHILFLVDQTPMYSGFLVQRNGLSGVLSIEGRSIIPCEYLYLKPVWLRRSKHPNDKEYQEIVFAFLGDKPNEDRNLISCDGKIAFKNICFIQSIQSKIEYDYEEEWADCRRITETITTLRINANSFNNPDSSKLSSAEIPELDCLDDRFDEALDMKINWEHYDHLYYWDYGCFRFTYSISIEENIIKFENIDKPSLKVKQNTGYVKRFSMKKPKEVKRIDFSSGKRLDQDLKKKSGHELSYALGKGAIRGLANRSKICGGLSINELDLTVREYNCLTRAGIHTVYDLCQLDAESIKRIRNLGSKGIDFVLGVQEAIHELYPDEQNDPPYQKGLLSPGTWMFPEKLHQYRDEWIAEGITKENEQGEKRRFIGFYPREFFVFDNFSSFSIMYDCVLYPTVEHAYQSLSFKGSDDALADEILHAKSAHDAQKIAYANKEKRRPTWENEKLRVMYDLLKCKVEQHPYVRQKLLQIPEDYEIVEDSPKDSYWGWGENRSGDNMLGKLWKKIQMELAEEIRHEPNAT